MSLETEIHSLAAAVAALADAVRSVATGRSMNAAAPAVAPTAPAAGADSTADRPAAAGTGEKGAAPMAESAPSAAAQTDAPTAQKTEKMSPVCDEKHPQATAPRTGLETAETAEDCKAELAADEYAGMDPAGFMAALHGLVKGLPNGGNILRAALEAIGEKSFRTLDKSKYGQAIGAVKAELTKMGA